MGCIFKNVLSATAEIANVKKVKKECCNNCTYHTEPYCTRTRTIPSWHTLKRMRSVVMEIVVVGF